MNRWEIWTWIAIGVLIFGSIAAFGWFLRDAVRLLRDELGSGSATAASEPGSDDSSALRLTDSPKPR